MYGLMVNYRFILLGSNMVMEIDNIEWLRNIG
jgi:hypothetical protein